jgi:hypothetical protein
MAATHVANVQNDVGPAKRFDHHKTDETINVGDDTDNQLRRHKT